MRQGKSVKLAPFQFLAFAALPAIVLAADSVVMKPGRWVETTTTQSATFDGKPMSLPDKPQIKPVCLSAAEGADPRLYFATVKDKERCVAPTGSVKGGKIALTSTCNNSANASPINIQVDVNGTYAREAYSASATMIAVSDNHNKAIVMMAITGRFDGSCHGDEETRQGSAK